MEGIAPELRSAVCTETQLRRQPAKTEAMGGDVPPEREGGRGGREYVLQLEVNLAAERERKLFVWAWRFGAFFSLSL